MNAALNGLGSQLFGWFGQLSIELAVLALVVLAAGRLLPIKSPALRHLLWVVVLLKPVVAVAVSSPFTLFTPFTPLLPLAESGRDALAFLPVEPPTVHAAASPIVAANSVGLTAAGWGAILWIAGAALLIGRILIGHGILWRLRRQAQVQRDGPLFDALRQARQAFDCYPRVEVATSSSIGSPMVLGILRPIIVFPADLVDKLRADELSLILMHELAHVRRWDNLVLLLHRLVAAVLFFHPAVWLCGRMLRREAEQACDDLVVCATGRAKAYARGLAHVAERGSHFNPFLRRIPTMNAFAAVESDLALRIRRTLGGGARRMGARARVLAAVLLCSLAVVTLPSCGTTGKRTGGDMEALAAKEVMAKAGQIESVELRARARLLAIQDSTVEEVPQRRLRGEAMAMATYHLAQGPPLALKSDTTIEEIAEAVRKRQEGGIPASAEALIRAALVVVRAMATPPDEWTEDLNADIERAGWDLDEFSEEIRSRRVWQEAMATDPDEWSEELKARILALTAPEKANLFIVLDQDGNMKLNGDESVTFATLKEELQAKRQLHDNTTMIIIQGDEDAARAQIVQVMEIARQVGLVDQVIATEPQRATE